MNRYSVALVCTVLNEEETIVEFLNSVFSMSRLPDELIIVDGGSSDNTAGLIRSFPAGRLGIQLIIEPDCNIARGRNIAIRHAQSPFIAITDAGCKVDTSWLELLMEPFLNDPMLDVVGGWMEPDGRTPFERWVGMLQKPFNAIDLTTYHPTARSLAVKKSCWEAVGGFPEELSMWGEDTAFFLRLTSLGCRSLIVPNAVVRWRPRRNLKEFWLQYFRYGIGDGEAGIYPKLFAKRFMLFCGILCLFAGIVWNWVLALTAIVLIGAAFLRLMMPLKRKPLGWWKLFPLFALTLVMETAQVFGYCMGWSRRKLHA